jgi:sorting nexin-3/12
LPGKALARQLPFRGDDGIFEEDFIEERRKGLEQFINKLDQLFQQLFALCDVPC